MAYYTYSPLSAYASRRSSKSKSPLPHLNEKSQKLGFKYTTIACFFIVLALLMTWCCYMESKKSELEIKSRYGSGKVSDFVMWCGSDWGKYLTWALWIIVLIILVPQAKTVRQTIF